MDELFTNKTHNLKELFKVYVTTKFYNMSSRTDERKSSTDASPRFVFYDRENVGTGDPNPTDPVHLEEITSPRFHQGFNLNVNSTVTK